MKRNEKKDWAKLLFLHENLTQKEIALKVGVTEKTMSAWVNNKDENWERHRASIIVTKEEELRRLYMQISELNSHIFEREEGKRFAVKGEADTLCKLTASARNLETETSLSDVIEVCKRIVNYLRPINLDQAKEITNVFDGFIKDCLKR